MEENNTFLIHLNDYNDLHTIDFKLPVIILAESGGTKTDWRIKSKNQITAFETCNFHPKTISIAQKKVIEILIKNIPTNSTLYFYGSGCLQAENQEIIKILFEPLALKKIFVKSDLVAAGVSIYGINEGYVGILGTGSVLCKYNNEQINTILGGYGYLLGDEGSGYYFGKLAIQKYLDNQCSIEYKELIETTFGNRSFLLEKIYGNDGKKFIGEFQLHTENTDLKLEINSIHRENIELFLTKYLPKNKTIAEISFVGSYAFFNEELLKESLLKRGVRLKKTIQKPIYELMKFHF